MTNKYTHHCQNDDVETHLQQIHANKKRDTTTTLVKGIYCISKNKGPNSKKHPSLNKHPSPRP